MILFSIPEWYDYPDVEILKLSEINKCKNILNIPKTLNAKA